MQYKFSVYNTYMTHDTIVQTVTIDDDYFWSTIYNMHVLIAKSIRLAVANRLFANKLVWGPLAYLSLKRCYGFAQNDPMHVWVVQVSSGNKTN